MKYITHFFIIFFINLMMVVQTTHAAAQCETMENVFSSEKLGAYLVVEKTHFLKKCRERDNLCETRQYVIPGDYLLAGYQGVNLCAAYIPETYEAPRAIGWVKHDANIELTKADEYQQISGNWSSDRRPLYKTIDFTISDHKAFIYGDLFSRTSNRMNFVEGDIFKINSNRYIRIFGECRDIIISHNEEELEYISHCDKDFDPYIFEGKYHRNDYHDVDNAQCHSIEENIFWALDFGSYTVGQKTHFLKACEAESGWCQTNQYVVPGDYLIAARYGEKLCAAYVPESYTAPRAIGWIKFDDNNKKTDQTDYEEIAGDWLFENDQVIHKIRIEVTDITSSETGGWLQAKFSSKSNDNARFYVDGQIYKSGKGRYVFVNNGTCRLDMHFHDGILDIDDKESCSGGRELTVSGQYQKSQF